MASKLSDLPIFTLVFLFGGVVNVEVGGYMSKIYKLNFSMSSYKKKSGLKIAQK